MPPRTAKEISQAIRAQLKILDPEISAEPLTPERKIIDTTAEILAESEAQTYVLRYQYDVDTKSGTDLDKFVSLFGFGRRTGVRASGFVTFSRITPAPQNVFIGARTQIIKPATTVTQAVVFRTINSAILFQGTTEVEVPVECVTPGEVGNVAANTIVDIGFTNPDVTEITNENATSGGTNAETDAELRVRFKNTIFRNISGTTDQYLALAIQHRFAKRANVIGPLSRFVEYLQVEDDLSINSQIPYSKFTYDFDYFVTDGNLIDEIFYSPGQHYTFSDAEPPVMTVLTDPATSEPRIPVGTVVLVEHQYCSVNSRNDPTNNVINAVDVYVSGDDEARATESLQFPGTSNNFVNSPTSKFHYANYQRIETAETPTINNKLQLLLWQPMTDVPETITINNVTYFKGSHYWPVKETTNYRGSRRARNGIEWLSSVPVGEGTNYIITYSFNRLPIITNELIDSHRPVGHDVLVHAANKRYFNVNLIVMYGAGFSPTSVNQAVEIALISFMENLNFGSAIQISDLIEVAHRVPGIDNVRLATPSDGVSYGIQEVAEDGSTLVGYPQTKDFFLLDSDLPVLNKLTATRRSTNTWTP